MWGCVGDRTVYWILHDDGWAHHYRRMMMIRWMRLVMKLLAAAVAFGGDG